MMSNGVSKVDSARHVIEEQFDAVKTSVKTAFDHIIGYEESRMKVFGAKVRDVIKAHPYAVVGIAVGIGFLAVRFARR